VADEAADDREPGLLGDLLDGVGMPWTTIAFGDTQIDAG
jgi:hypothetical protein